MYKELLNEFLNHHQFITEREFNDLFPNLKQLDVNQVCWKFNPEDNDIITAIIETIADDCFYVIDCWEGDKSISVELYDNCSKEDIDRCIKILEDNEWTINNKEDIYEDYEDKIIYDKKQALLSKLKDYSYEELKALIDGN